MIDLRVVPWKRYGHDRLYVNRADGENVAWLDRTTGKLTVLIEEYREAAVEALASYRTAPPPPEAPAVPERSRRPRTPPPRRPPHPSSIPPVPPQRSRGPSQPPPVPPRTPPVPPRPPSSAVPRRPSRPPRAARPAPTVTPTASVRDLAANRPGEAVRAKIAELAPGFWQSVLNLLLNRPTEADSWRKGLAGEKAVAAELDRLPRRDWRVLHSIPLPRDVDIDHLLIGPGGVFTINAKHHRGARIWVGDDMVRIGGHSHPYVRKARAEARRASAALSRACGFPVAAEPVLAFVGAERLTVVPTLRDVRALAHRDFAAFRDLRGVLRPAAVDAIHTAARRPATWLTA